MMPACLSETVRASAGTGVRTWRPHSRGWADEPPLCPAEDVMRHSHVFRGGRGAETDRLALSGTWKVTRRVGRQAQRDLAAIEPALRALPTGLS